jgi:predicted nucleic acid-binding Zn ribbon protein
MKREINILCVLCGDEIPSGRRSYKYCSEECAYSDKLIRERERNRTKTHSYILLKNDDLLHELFIEYGSETYISAKRLTDRNFNWELNHGIQKISGVNAYIQIRYAYTLFSNQKIRIWKL